MQVTADDIFEMEIKVSGSFSRGYAPTHDDPGADDQIDDLEIEDIGIVTSVPAPERERGSHRTIFKTVSILDGVDRKSDAYRQIVANILAIRNDAACEALFAEASE